MRLLISLSGLLCGALSVDIFVKYYRTLSYVRELEYTNIAEPGSVFHWAGEGFGTSHWFEHGVRGKNEPVEHGQILVLGDSYTEALQVDDDEVFTFQLEDILRRESISEKKIYNTGQSGLSAIEYYGFAKRFEKVFKPHWTIIQIRDEDITSPLWASPSAAAQTKSVSDFFKEMPGYNSLDVEMAKTAREKSWEERYFSWLHLLPYGREVWERYAQVARKEQFFKQIPSPAYQPLAPINSEHLTWEEKIGEAAPLGMEIDAIVQAYKGRITFVYLPEVSFDTMGTLQSKVYQKLKAHCEAKNISLVTMNERFATLVRSWHSPYGFPNGEFYRGHLNAAGHRIVAEELAQEIKRLKNRAVF